MEKRPVDMPWKGLDRALEGGCTNEEVRAAFPNEALEDEWLNERRELLKIGAHDEVRKVEGKRAFEAPEYLSKLENTIAEFADRVVEPDELLKLVEAARGLECAKMTAREVCERPIVTGVPF